jgi:RHS repeat-associated protein
MPSPNDRRPHRPWLRRSLQTMELARRLGALALEQLEQRSMMDAWGARVDFTNTYGMPSRPYEERVMDTRVVALPADVPLPASLNVSWAADDDVRVNGQRLGTGYAGSGSTTVSVSSRSVTLELIDTVGVNSGGYVVLDLGVIVPADTGSEGPVCDRCPDLGPSFGDGFLRYYDGSVESGGGSNGLGDAIGLTLASSGSRSPGAGTSGTTAPFGNGWSRTASPTLTTHGVDPTRPAAVSISVGGTDTRVFRDVAAAGATPVFVRASGQGSTATFVASGSQYVFRTLAGSTLTFNGYDSTVPAAARGQLVSRVDAPGNRLVYSFNPDGSTARITSSLAGQSLAQEIQDYAYLPATDPNVGKVGRIDIRRGDTTLVRSVVFAYHTGASPKGALGDLASLTVRDAAGRLIDSRHYRYVAAVNGASLLQYAFDFDAARRATAAGINLTTATNSAVAPFASNFYQYDAQNRVIRHDLQGVGCSSCTGGIGTFTYAYATNPRAVFGSNVDWRTKTTETRPDGTQRIVYSNVRLQPMLEVMRTTEGGVTKQYGTHTRYDSRGLPVWVASPEAVTLPANLADIEQYPDLLNEVAGNFQYISDSSGLIEVTNYATATTATATAAGSVARFVESAAMQRGELGVPAAQEAFTYFLVRANDGSAVAPLATRTTYPNTTTAGGQTTSYDYTFTVAFAQGWTTQIVSQRTTLPVVSTAQNGPGTAVVVEQVFDAAGREIWSRDGDGFLRYTQYDPGTAAVVKTIVDVNTARTGEFQGLPAGWGTRAGGGLHLVTAFEADRLGRTVKATAPNGNVSYVVYDDVNHSTRTYVGWNTSTLAPTGPIEVSRRDLSGTYTESLTYWATPAVDAQGRPTGTEAITNLQSLTRSLVNTAGQVIATDRYTNLSGLAYSAAMAALGAEGTNYLRTRYAYNNQGQVERVQNPAGTITISTFDGLARGTGTWVGTNDSTTNGFKWSPSNAAPSSNMVQTAAYEYDSGGVGNGNLTRATRIPVSSSPQTTQYAYDWRGRAVVIREGSFLTPAEESLLRNRPFTFLNYDNLDRVTSRLVFDGDGVAIVDANSDGIPDAPAAALLRSSQVSLYDSWDRVYESQDLFVDQSTGAVGTPRLTTDMFYDRRGNVAAVYAPNAPVIQRRYDGAGRLTSSFTLGNVPAATWASATSFATSVMLEQTDYAYDAAGNVILTTNRQRFHDASPTAVGGLGSALNPARVSYLASYYDAADRLTASVNVGTNGGLSYGRPATAPTRSDTTLVTSYAYGPDGRVQDVTDPRGIVSRTLYDALGRTTASIANFTGGAAAAQTDVTTLFAYDSAGRLASRTAVQPAGTPSQVTGYVYGVSTATGSAFTSNDILAETRYPDPLTGQASAAERDRYTTNALGERTSVTDRSGTTRTFSFDMVGRQTADTITTLGTGVDGAVRRIGWAYDTLGRVTSVTSFNAPTGGTAFNQVARVYGGFGQLTSERQAHTGLVDTTTTPQVQYAYSEGGGGNHSRQTQITYPDGFAVATTYEAGIDDAVSRPTYLSGQRANNATLTAVLETYKYLGTDTVIELSRPQVNFATLSMVSLSGASGDAGDAYTGLDRFGRVVDHRWTTGTGSTTAVVDQYGYSYDRNFNRRTRSNALAAAFSETYTYDGLDQIQSFTRPGGTTMTQQWQFDALGNWTALTTNGVPQSRVPNAQNEVTQMGATALAFSRSGTLATDAQGRTLQYDAWNRLVSVKNASGTEVARYEYDGLGRRIVAQVGTLASPAAATAPVRDNYYSKDWQVLEERVRTSPGTIPNNADVRYYWSTLYVDALIARDRNADGNATTGNRGLEQRVYALQDANWNTTAILVASGVPGFTTPGAVITRFAYTPYGEVELLTASWTAPAPGSTPATPWSHLFQGLVFTDVTGLAHVRHRDYSASLGRFIQLDPMGYDAGDNNWYRFVGNGPVGRWDPSGLEAMAISGGFVTTTSGCTPGAITCGGQCGNVGRDQPPRQGDAPGNGISSALDAVQFGLDLLGLVPVAGEAFDGLNGLISLGRGDLTGAGLSFAGMYPVGGQAATAAKFGLKYGDEVAAAGKCAARKQAGDTLDRLQEAKRQFQKNSDFRNWAHKEFMEDLKMGGGGRRNPNMPDSMIADAYEEWLQLGRPHL